MHSLKLDVVVLKVVIPSTSLLLLLLLLITRIKVPTKETFITFNYVKGTRATHTHR